MTTLPTGKLDAQLLSRLLAALPAAPEAVVGPGPGHDVTVLDVGGPELLVATTDPITFATDALGYYAVAVNANDIATCGGRPRWLLATLLLPAGQSDGGQVEAIFGQLTATCRQVGAVLVGGHTEVTAACTTPVVVGQLLGTVAPERLVRPDGMRPGDALLLTKQVPLEGTALLARECRDTLAARGYSAAELAALAGLLYDPGIMVLAEAQALCDATRPHAMHDPTEGGLATGLWELAEASHCGLRVDYDRLPLLPQGVRLCRELDLDPLGLIASGSLLAAVAPAEVPAALAACAAAGIACSQIGEATAAGEGVVLARPGRAEPLARYDQDEITRVL